MLCRRTVRAFSPCASPLLSPSMSTPATRSLIAPTFRLQPTRLSSSASSKARRKTPTSPASSASSETPAGLTPPWQVSDLGPSEKELYEKHGPNYIEHVSDPTLRKTCLKHALGRAKAAQQLRANYGPNWYDIIKEADARFQSEFVAPFQAEYKRRRDLLGPVVNTKKPSLLHRELFKVEAAFKEKRSAEKLAMRQAVWWERRNQSKQSVEGY